MDSRTGLFSVWALEKAAAPQGSQLIWLARFGFGENRKLTKGLQLANRQRFAVYMVSGRRP